MIRVVVTGSECTGKTTLAEALADHYNTVWVPEFARQFVLEKGAAPAYADIDAMARGQIELEDAFAGKAQSLLVQDTDLLSTVVYSRHYYGDCPPWVEDALLERSADLYLLAGIDVPWISDGNLRDRGDRRQEMQELFRRALIDYGFDFCAIHGPIRRRLRESVSAIDSLPSG